ncbi:MAG: DUF2892 domain-containing protein [Granulosicoccus sp.]
MARNVGSTDRIIRFLVGAALIAMPFLSGLPFFDAALPKYAAVAVGLILVVTAIANFCPIYRILGIKTCRV